MTIGPVIRLISDTDEPNQATKLLCPFCGRESVVINQVKECTPRKGLEGKLSNNIILMDRAICEFQASCSACKKNYRQSCPASRLPREFRTPIAGPAEPAQEA